MIFILIFRSDDTGAPDQLERPLDVCGAEAFRVVI